MQISICYYAKSSYKDEKDSFYFYCVIFFFQIGSFWCPKLKFSEFFFSNQRPFLGALHANFNGANALKNANANLCKCFF